MPGSTGSQQPKLLDQARQVLCLHHYSIHTDKKINIPVVMKREEVAAVLSLMDGTAQ